MLLMRNLSDDYKVSFRSIDEVDQALGVIVARVRAKFRGRKAKASPILNALILWLDALPLDEQRRIVADGMARLESILDADSDDSDADASPRAEVKSDPDAGPVDPPHTLRPDSRGGRRKRDAR